MATYKEIFGKQIKFLSSDPANEATGQIWYNSTSGTFKTVLSGGAWSSSTPLITATVAGATLGTQTAALITSGYGYPSAPAGIPQTQIYDGSGWSAGGALTDPRNYFAGAGTTAAGLVFGGTDTSPPYRTGVTEEYNGTAWSEESDLGTARYMLVATGTQTAAMCITGNASPSNIHSTAVEDYNGASWTAGTATSIGKHLAMGCGTSTASVAFGGNINPYVIVGSTEDWNGTAWSAGGAMNTARRAGGGVGIQTAALCFGGAQLPSPSPTRTNVTENYDGSTWTTNPATLATASADQDGMGTNTAALLAGGNPGTPPHNLETEEYNVGTTVITAAAWAAGGTYPTNASGAAVAGTQDAAIAFGGTVYPGPNGPTNISATYDGSSWTLTPVINTSRSNSASAKNGSQTAALMIAGNAPGISNACEEYNGASWSTVNTYPLSARIHDQGTGTQIAALCSAGYGGGPGSAYLTTTCTYDGTNWTALAAPSDMNAGRFSGTTVGTQTAAVMFGGTSPGGSGLVESWDGSTWSEEAATFNVPRNAGGSAGTSTDAIFFGGEPAGNGASTEHWNGTSFSTRPNLATSHYAMGSTGTATAGLSVGGAGGAVNETEEYSGSTTALNYKTITTS